MHPFLSFLILKRKILNETKEAVCCKAVLLSNMPANPQCDGIWRQTLGSWKCHESRVLLHGITTSVRGQTLCFAVHAHSVEAARSIQHPSTQKQLSLRTQAPQHPHLRPSVPELWEINSCHLNSLGPWYLHIVTWPKRKSYNCLSIYMTRAL